MTPVESLLFNKLTNSSYLGPEPSCGCAIEAITKKTDKYAKWSPLKYPLSINDKRISNVTSKNIREKVLFFIFLDALLIRAISLLLNSIITPD
jgi:hypothetical protein